MNPGAEVVATDPPHWPSAWVPPSDFAAYVEARKQAGGASIHANTQDLYLVCAFASAGWWRRWRRSRRATRSRCAAPSERLRLSADDVAELTQILLHELLLGHEGSPPALGSYAGRGTLSAWVRVTATRKGLKTFRRSPARELADDEVLEKQAPGDDPELTYLRSLYGEAFRKAFLTAHGRPSTAAIRRRAPGSTSSTA